MTITGINIKGKYVKVKDDRMESTVAPKLRIFLAEDGFGCHPDTIGSKVFAIQVATGIRDYMRRNDVERLATDEEISLAKGETK